MRILVWTLVGIAILVLDEQIDELRHEMNILQIRIEHLEEAQRRQVKMSQKRIKLSEKKVDEKEQTK